MACIGTGAPSPRLAVELARELAFGWSCDPFEVHETYTRRWLLTMCVRVGGLSVGGGDSGGDAGGDEDSKGAVVAREGGQGGGDMPGAMAKQVQLPPRHFAQACIGRLRSAEPCRRRALGAGAAEQACRRARWHSSVSSWRALERRRYATRQMRPSFTHAVLY